MYVFERLVQLQFYGFVNKFVVDSCCTLFSEGGIMKLVCRVSAVCDSLKWVD